MTLVPVGVSDFEKLRRREFFFVDKSMFVAEIMRSSAEVTMLPRPRRFGKTLNLSMLYYFLDHERDNRGLFEDLAVSDHEDVMAHCGAWPTVFITFKDIKYSDFEQCCKALTIQLSDTFLHHRVPIESVSEGNEARMVQQLIDGEADLVVQQRALQLLTKLLHRATGKQVMVLIDEYDMPIHGGHHHGYHDDIVRYAQSPQRCIQRQSPSAQRGIDGNTQGCQGVDLLRFQ